MSVPGRTPMRTDVTLPAQYGEALDVADAMLRAANAGDWPAVDALRRTLPALARAMDRRWAALESVDPQVRRRLDGERLAAIRRILTVDDRIRHLAEPGRCRVDALLRGDPGRSGRALN